MATGGATTAFDPVVGTVDEGRSWVGRPRIRGACAPITTALILPFVASLEDGNPRWWEQGEVPPALLMTLGMTLPWEPKSGRSHHQLIVFDVPLPGPSLIGSTIESELRRPVWLGDRITVAEEIVAISEEKTTELGIGHFVTWRLTYTNQDDVVCAIDTVQSLRYRPH